MIPTETALTAPLRSELRSRERLLEEARVLSTSLTVGQLYTLGELEFASGGPGFRATEATTAQERGFADLFKAALDVIPSGSSWAEFASNAGTSVVSKPLDFFEAAAMGIRDYVADELKGYADVATGVGSWLMDGGMCVLQQIRPRPPFLEPDVIGGSGSCDGLKKVAESVQTVLRAIAKVKQIGFARLIEMGKALLNFIGEMFSELLTVGMDLLGQWKTEIEEWLQRISKNVTELGKLAGMLLGAVLVEWLTAGVGRALKGARAAQKFAVSLPTPEGTLIVVPAHPTFLPEAVAGAAAKIDEILEQLSKAFQKVIAKHQPQLTRRLNAHTHGILHADFPVGVVGVANLDDISPWDIRGFIEHRDEIFDLIKKRTRESRGRIGSYGDNVKFQEPLNRNVVVAHQADALVEVHPAAMDPLELEGRKNAILPDLFESNHIFEQRLIKHPDFFRQFDKEWELLGWTKRNPVTNALEPDVTKMTSILMPAQEHTSSVRQMYKRFGFSKADLDDLAPEMPESITTLLKKYIRLPGQTSPRLDVPPRFGGPVFVDPTTNFEDILEKLATIYQSEVPHLWNNADQPMDLFRQFNQWRQLLNNRRIVG